jgi:cytochrome c peroxidase
MRRHETTIGLAIALLYGCSSSDPASPAQSDAGAPDVVQTNPPPTPPPPPPPPPGPDPYDGFTKAQWDQMKTLSPLPAVPADTTNAYADNAQAAALGQMLFFDKSYSGALVVGDDGTNGGLGAAGDTGKVSCASCHGGAALEDNRSKPNNVSLGVDYGTRNALDLVNSSFYAWTNWSGRFDSQWSLPLAVAENAKIMKSTRLQIAHLLWNKYRTEYNAIFPVPLDAALDPAANDASRFPASGKPKAAPGDPDGPWEFMAAADRDIVNVIFANYGKTIAAYVRKLVSRNAPFDKYVAGDRTAISDAAKRGLKVFLGAGGCVSCHSSPTFSDDKVHALAVPQSGPHVPATDLGRFQDVPALLSSPFNVNGNFSDDKTTAKLTGLAQDASQRGQFRTKGLRNVARSGPFMHTGGTATLADVITFYAAGDGDPGDAGVTKDALLKPFTLQGTDATDLERFLETLNGEAVPAALLQDTSK